MIGKENNKGTNAEGSKQERTSERSSYKRRRPNKTYRVERAEAKQKAEITVTVEPEIIPTKKGVKIIPLGG